LELGVIYGDSDCLDGYQGYLNPDGSFRTCHLTIYVPTWFERNTILIIILVGVFIIVAIAVGIFVQRKLRQRYLALMAQRRASRRTSEESTGPSGTAFGA